VARADNRESVRATKRLMRLELEDEVPDFLNRIARALEEFAR